MKAVLLNLIGFLIVCTSSSFRPPVTTPASSAVASSEVFGRLSVHRQHNATALTWYTINNENISGFIVERSYDGSWFESIGDAAVTSSMKYQYMDNNVFPGYLYYRIAAVMNDGSVVYSDVEVLRIVSRKGW